MSAGSNKVAEQRRKGFNAQDARRFYVLVRGRHDWIHVRAKHGVSTVAPDKQRGQR